MEETEGEEDNTIHEAAMQIDEISEQILPIGKMKEAAAAMEAVAEQWRLAATELAAEQQRPAPGDGGREEAGRHGGSRRSLATEVAKEA